MAIGHGRRRKIRVARSFRFSSTDSRTEMMATGSSASKMAANEAAFGESGGLDGVEPDGVTETVSVADDT
jgi:hypothetical protein